MTLVRFWLMQLFKIPIEYNNDDQKYFHDFFTKQLSILDCKIRVPRKTRWRGHPFYYEVLKLYGKTVEYWPKSVENILSVPLWYNSFLGTRYNVKVSQLGYNFLRDLFRESKLLTQGDLSHLQPSIYRAIINLTSKIPDRITAIMNNSIP